MFFGNLSIKDFERRTGWTFSDADRKWLESHRQDYADVKFDSGKFHIFDLPFTVSVSAIIKNDLVKILTKYNDKQMSKESIQIAEITETTEEREKRLKQEQLDLEFKDKLENPNSEWIIKWHMFVPIKIHTDEKDLELYYGCFINTFTTGYRNIPVNLPSSIKGKGHMYKDEVGFHGTFKTEDYSDYIIGSGFYTKNGTLLYSDFNFDDIEFDLAEAYELRKNVTGSYTREVHFYR